MMQFAARGALAVPAAENIEILVHLARHNKVFGDLARMTLAGWDEKASLAAAANPQTTADVLDYFISPDNLRPRLLPALLENHSVSEGHLVKLAISASRDSIEVMLKSPRVRSLGGVLEALRANPYLKKEEAEELAQLSSAAATSASAENSTRGSEPIRGPTEAPESATSPEADEGEDDEVVSSYLQEHA